ncbi:MAG: hypothetical protein AAFQ13_05930 [Pseudomonadota bacterium]
MTIHFAAAKTGPSATGRGPLPLHRARELTGRAMENVANDNGLSRAAQLYEDAILRAALNHFAEQGIGASRTARAQAEAAFLAGDSQGFDWWLGITRTLDRRMAAEVARLTGHSVQPRAQQPSDQDF